MDNNSDNAALRTADDYDLESKCQEATSTPAQVQTREQMIEICQQTIKLRVSGNLDELMRSVAPDCRLRIIGSSGSNPLSATCIGHEQIRQRIGIMNVLIEYCDVTPIGFVVDGDQIVVRWKGRWRNRGTGPAEELEGVAHVTYRDGLVVDYTNFVDTAVIARMLDWPNQQRER